MPAAHIVILGLMGAGKTTLGRGLATALGWPMSDSDAYLEQVTGRTARQLRDELGADELHRLEAQHLLHALAQAGPDIVCAAASVVEDEACRAALAGPGITNIWLRGSATTLAARFDSSKHRPAYGVDPVAFLAEQQARREHLFAQCAAVTVDTDGKTPADVLTEVLASLPPA